MDDVTPTVLGVVEAGERSVTVRSVTSEDPTRPVLVLVPAMGVPAGYYRPFAQNLHAQGCTVVSFDLRGQGENLPPASRAVTCGYQDLVDDVGAVVDLVQASFPKAPVYLVGHSLGGQLALLYAAAEPSRVHGVVLVAAGSVWFRSFRGVPAFRTLIGTQVVSVLSRLLGFWPGDRLGFGGRQPRGVMRDWARQARSGQYVLSGATTDYEAALRTLRSPVLAVSVEGDHLAPQSAVDHLSGKAVQAVRTRRHYTRADSGADKLGHFAWVRSGHQLAAWIGEWVSAQFGSAQEAHDAEVGRVR